MMGEKMTPTLSEGKMQEFFQAEALPEGVQVY